MIRGVLGGALVLVVLYVLLQEGTSSKVEGAGNVAVTGLRRFMSGEVAGVPNYGPKALAKKIEPSTGGGRIAVPGMSNG